MLKIGLTGGIGSGKTTVANLFKEQGAPVIDADDIAHELVETGKPALILIEKAFGPEIINSNGSLDRAALRELIFAHPDKKKLLESILHPLVYIEMLNRMDLLQASYVILSIPLLLETNMQQFVQRVLVVDCSTEIQFKRVKNRDRMPDKTIDAIIRSQVSRECRISAADDLIENSNGITKLAEQIKKLHNLYLSLSTS